DEVKDSVQIGEELDSVEVDGERYLMFKQREFPPLKHLPDYDIVSSLVQMHEEVKTWRLIGIAIVVAFFGLALTLLNFQNNLYREIRGNAQQVMDLERRVDQRIDSLSKRLDDATTKQGMGGLQEKPSNQEGSDKSNDSKRKAKD
ncbi:MAG: hypothetical protein ACRD2L_24230, partial [Terriglobia bacterium]